MRMVAAAAMACLLAAACSTPQAPYLSDAVRNIDFDIANLSTPSIQPEDLLYIYVYSQTPESTVPFNEETNRGAYRGPAQGYRVSQSGHIVFPMLGHIEVAGKSMADVASDLERRLRDSNYVDDAIVTVSLMNFHVSVIGEVKRPGVLHCDNGRLTIFEALAQCGDITTDGLRNKVVVVRNGVSDRMVDTLDLTSGTVLNSPYYYLQQNDIVFVEPTPKKRRMAYRDEDWPRYMTMGFSALDIAYRTVYYIQRVNANQ